MIISIKQKVPSFCDVKYVLRINRENSFFFSFDLHKVYRLISIPDQSICLNEVFVFFGT